MTRRLLIICLFLCAVAVLSLAVAWFALISALGPLAERGNADLESASERLVGQLHRYRQVAVQLADHPALSNPSGLENDATHIQGLLQHTADQSGALSISYANITGEIIVSSDPGEAGNLIAGSSAFQRALHGALGQEHAILPASTLQSEPHRAFSFFAPVFSDQNVTGTVIVRIDMEAVEESDWRGGPEAIFFSDQNGLIFVSNRSELLFRKRPNRTPQQPGHATTFAASYSLSVAGQEIWILDAGRYLPWHALYVTRPLPVIGLTGEALIDTAPAERLAILQGLATAALCLAFGALLFLATERRRALALANSWLEGRVDRRTRALTESNERLQKAQAELVQAAKLSALGQMSAGISHELNQPLMAIRNFAENANVFLERGQHDATAANLTRIGDMTGRIDRIIRNLRAFARQEIEPVRQVDVTAAIETAIELTEAHLRQNDVTLQWQPPSDQVFACAGEVRLVQVFVNLITNAVDAMAESELRRLRIVVNNGTKLSVTVRDTGPGITAPEKMFDPFYSTKEVGQSSDEGMGLGLSISYGIVQSFGGAIRGANITTGNDQIRGAMMTVDLEYWRDSMNEEAVS